MPDHLPAPDGACEVLLVHFRIRRAHAAEFDDAVRRNARASLQTEPGCRQFDVCRDPADATRFFLYERYDDEAAIAAHRRTPHYLAMQAQTADWVESVTVEHWRRP